MPSDHVVSNHVGTDKESDVPSLHRPATIPLRILRGYSHAGHRVEAQRIYGRERQPVVCRDTELRTWIQRRHPRRDVSHQASLAKAHTVDALRYEEHDIQEREGLQETVHVDEVNVHIPSARPEVQC